ncbi:MAG: bifunctional 2-polyprenyl-6-hydroxyphenol methylase/3-demethylubiquinol 3-O-methyltransferase UbiG [Rhodospirillales bacterium]
MTASPGPSSVDRDEIARFEATAAEWWDEDGPFKPLHRLNPARMTFVRDALCDHFDRDPTASAPLKDLRIIDVGCGGGLISEPLARLGAAVTAIDAGAEAVGVASTHAAAAGLAIDFRQSTAEAIVAQDETFDAVVSLEVIEHVADVAGFLASLANLTRPGGMAVLGTINRTLKSLALAKVGAEYVLRWVPAGTHDWRQFVRPSEMARGLRPYGLDLTDLRGVVYNPVSGAWKLSPDIDVNYLASFAKHP